MTPRNKRLTLFFRVFSRQNQDISRLFDETEARLKEVLPQIQAEPVSEFRRQCFSDEICSAKESGYLLTLWDGTYHYIIREQQYTLWTPDAEESLEKAINHLPNTFSAAKIEATYETELVAI